MRPWRAFRVWGFRTSRLRVRDLLGGSGDLVTGYFKDL